MSVLRNLDIYSILHDFSKRISCRPAPLVIYAFSNSEELKQKCTKWPFLESTTLLITTSLQCLTRQEAGRSCSTIYSLSCEFPICHSVASQNPAVCHDYSHSHTSPETGILTFFGIDGAYTGKASFDTFSHRRGFVNVPPSYVHVPLSDETTADLYAHQGGSDSAVPIQAIHRQPVRSHEERFEH